MFRTYAFPAFRGWPELRVAGTTKLVALPANAWLWTTSFIEVFGTFGPVLSKMFTRIASGVNPGGTVQLSVGVNPLPEIAGLRTVINEIIEQRIPVNKSTLAMARKLLQQLPDL